MVDISQSLLAKSDQLNAADLIDPLAIQIDKVNYDPDRIQPLWIYYNKNKNPWKPSKGMRKVIASEALLGLETDNWVGAKLRIFREATVKYAGKAVGGIEICESDRVKAKKNFPVRINKASSRPLSVSPLKLSEKEEMFFNELYGNSKPKPQAKESNKFLSEEQVNIITGLLGDAEWDINDFCKIMKVDKISNIESIKFIKIKTKLEAKAKEAEQIREMAELAGGDEENEDEEDFVIT